MPSPIANASRNRFFKYGAPFLVLLVGGSFGLKEFAKLRYQFRKGGTLTPAEAEAMGVSMKKERRSLEDEYKALQEKDIDNWENIRGPRPWEDSKTFQQEQRKVLNQQS